MQKIRKASRLLLVFSTVAFVAFIVFEFLSRDTKPPVITIPEEACVMSVQDPEETMLQGVTAKDNRSGDVTASVVVEKISSQMEDGSRVITYAAIDENGNVGRKERPLKYTDYEPPVFSFSAPLRVQVNDLGENYLKDVHVSSSLDGDLSNKVKFHLTNDMYINGEGSYPIELKVEDSTGMIVTLPTWLEVYDPKTEAITVELTAYLVYLNVGDSFDAESYYSQASMEGDLSVDTNVDTSTPGVYYADYTVHGTHTVGSTRLVVIVQ